MRGLWRKLLGREEVPAEVAGRLAPDERVLATAELGAGRHLVVTSLGMWLPADDGPRLLGWHLVSKAGWQGGTLTLVEAQEIETLGGAVLITDLPPQRLRLTGPGRVPESVQARVEGSIRSRHHRELPGGGAWFVQRKVPGRDGVVLQVRPDPGTDEAAVRQVAADVARSLGLS
ncbi:hypothetical protein [Pseudonocardia sp. MH-G8]|uniref:hypothetical protein n=1 Tax=Pseudonocardia sp. MH-G8 TaxID=1854588 RepID=UPI000B9FBDC4|nr:hypothetical protein [Pseudonocardia sp. MH-G8]OZM79101.1 hypothetical protein CFP66_27660 [Pseudonocardia sp. MH-G8]